MWVIATAGQESVYWVFLLLMGGIPVYVVVTRNKNLNEQAQQRQGMCTVVSPADVKLN